MPILWSMWDIGWGLCPLYTSYLPSKNLATDLNAMISVPPLGLTLVIMSDSPHTSTAVWQGVFSWTLFKIIILLLILLQLLIPSETPLDEDVDYEKLSEFEMSGGDIKSAIFRAASRAALRPEKLRRLMMDDLVGAAKEEIGKASTRNSFRRQDSDAARMYN